MATPRCRTSSHQKHERVNFCWLMPPSLWNLVTAASGMSIHTSLRDHVTRANAGKRQGLRSRRWWDGIDEEPFSSHSALRIVLR